MKILLCSGEVYPYSKTGGLADVSAALPKALIKLGHQVKIITPFYQSVKEQHLILENLGETKITMGTYDKVARFYQTDYQGVHYVFVENDELFERPKLYGYEDDAIRFTFFNFAILEFIKMTKDFPDILHLNDWQTGMVPFLLDSKYRQQDRRFYSIKTVLSIHNLEKQGSYPIETEKLFGVKNFTYLHLDRVNFLKSGIMRANVINTVSENYKNEILTRFYGFSLDYALRSRASDLYGILNGLDQDLYNPKTSTILSSVYDESDFIQGKKNNKKELINSLGFDVKDIPLIVFNNRFARQKGIDLLMNVIEDYIKDEKIYFIAIGSGDMLYESFFRELQFLYPSLVYYHQGFDHDFSETVYAASDLFLLPSLFEPCGLNHMIAMRYGTLPIVRETGGLKDTVTPYNKFTNIGNGFTFKNYDQVELIEAIDLALSIYHDDKEAFHSLIKQAMQVNYSLDRMAKQYESLYLKIVQEKS